MGRYSPNTTEDPFHEPQGSNGELAADVRGGHLCRADRQGRVANAPALPAMASSNAGSGSAARENVGTPVPAMRDGVKVYYLHGNTRCPTCRTIEAYAQEAVQTGFARELNGGLITWEVINYESPGNEHYATDYEVVAPNVVLARFVGGKQVEWKGLPEVWEHVGDKVAFLSFVQTNLREFLGGSPSQPSDVPASTPAAAESPALSLPIPE